jgi:hypothetical protein
MPGGRGFQRLTRASGCLCLADLACAQPELATHHQPADRAVRLAAGEHDQRQLTTACRSRLAVGCQKWVDASMSCAGTAMKSTPVIAGEDADAGVIGSLLGRGLNLEG